MNLSSEALNGAVVAGFVTVYVGMLLGRLPRLKLGCSGVWPYWAVGVIGLAVLWGWLSLG